RPLDGQSAGGDQQRRRPDLGGAVEQADRPAPDGGGEYDGVRALVGVGQVDRGPQAARGEVVQVRNGEDGRDVALFEALDAQPGRRGPTRLPGTTVETKQIIHEISP